MSSLSHSDGRFIALSETVDVLESGHFLVQLLLYISLTPGKCLPRVKVEKIAISARRSLVWLLLYP